MEQVITKNSLFENGDDVTFLNGDDIWTFTIDDVTYEEMVGNFLYSGHDRELISGDNPICGVAPLWIEETAIIPNSGFNIGDIVSPISGKSCYRGRYGTIIQINWIAREKEYSYKIQYKSEPYESGNSQYDYPASAIEKYLDPMDEIQKVIQDHEQTILNLQEKVERLERWANEKEAKEFAGGLKSILDDLLEKKAAEKSAASKDEVPDEEETSEVDPKVRMERKICGSEEDEDDIPVPKDRTCKVIQISFDSSGIPVFKEI